MAIKSLRWGLPLKADPDAFQRVSGTNYYITYCNDTSLCQTFQSFSYQRVGIFWTWHTGTEPGAWSPDPSSANSVPDPNSGSSPSSHWSSAARGLSTNFNSWIPPYYEMSRQVRWVKETFPFVTFIYFYMSTGYGGITCSLSLTLLFSVLLETEITSIYVTPMWS